MTDPRIRSAEHAEPLAEDAPFGGWGSVRRWHLFGDESGAAPMTLIAEAELAPESGAALHHLATEDELLYILGGHGRFRRGEGVETEVWQGDAILVRAGEQFALVNPEEPPLRYLVVRWQASTDRPAESA